MQKGTEPRTAIMPLRTSWRVQCYRRCCIRILVTINWATGVFGAAPAMRSSESSSPVRTLAKNSSTIPRSSVLELPQAFRMGRWHVYDQGVLAGSSPQTPQGKSDQSLTDAHSALLRASQATRPSCACFSHRAQKDCKNKIFVLIHFGQPTQHVSAPAVFGAIVLA